jgi:hypothetical protein
MSAPEDKAIHVSQTGESWDVETASTPLASAGSKEEAIELAKAEAAAQEAKAIVVHTSDGMVEKEIEVPPPAPLL